MTSLVPISAATISAGLGALSKEPGPEVVTMPGPNAEVIGFISISTFDSSCRINEKSIEVQTDASSLSTIAIHPVTYPEFVATERAAAPTCATKLTRFTVLHP